MSETRKPILPCPLQQIAAMQAACAERDDDEPDTGLEQPFQVDDCPSGDAQVFATDGRIAVRRRLSAGFAQPIGVRVVGDDSVDGAIMPLADPDRD